MQPQIHSLSSLCLFCTGVQARIAFIESDACQAALKKLDQEVVPPAGYNAALHVPSSLAFDGQGADVISDEPGAADVGDDGVRLPSAAVDQLQRLLFEVCLLLTMVQGMACTLLGLVCGCQAR